MGGEVKPFGLNELGLYLGGAPGPWSGGGFWGRKGREAGVERAVSGSFDCVARGATSLRMTGFEGLGWSQVLLCSG